MIKTHLLQHFRRPCLRAPFRSTPQSRSYIICCTCAYTKVYTSFPDWLSLSRPHPEGQVVNVRRECQVALDIKLKELPATSTQRSVKWKGLVIPSTANVKTEDYRGEEDLLHISVRVLGADTKREYKAICDACSKREGKKKGKPSLLDFHAASNVIRASEDGLVQVKFKFSCYPKHQHPNESAYL